MELFLDTTQIPQYFFSSDRQFGVGEKHITRFCNEDVLLLMYDGVLRFYEDGIPIELCSGEYYIQRRGLFQQGVEKSDAPHYFYIHFQGAWSEKGGLPRRGHYPPELPNLIQELDILPRDNETAWTHTAAFLKILCALYQEENESAPPPLAQRIEQALRAHIKEDITIHVLASIFNYSPNYIIRVFRDFHGKTPHEYLTELRLKEAEQHLLYSDLSLSSIAKVCGFGSYINFYKAYQKAYGRSPRQKPKSK